MSFSEIMKRIAQRVAELLAGLLSFAVGSVAYVAASAVEGWRQARTPEETHHARADDDDEEARRVMAEAARLDALAAATDAAPRRRVCKATDDPQSGAPAAPAPAPRTLGRVPAARPGHRIMLLELPANDEAEELGLDAVLPLLR